MACAREEDPEPVVGPPSVRIVHQEKGNCCVILWHLEHFTTCADIDYGLSSLFKVNVRSSRNWSFEMCFKTEVVEERQFYGICLEPVIIIPDDIRITCRFAIVENNCELYSAEPCFLSVTKLTGHVVFGHLIEKEFLYQNESRFLHHDTLLIRCELNVESSKMQPEGFPSAEDYRNIISNDFVCNMMGDFYKDRKYSDLTWALSANVENVHKSILAARSQKISEDLTVRIGLQPDVQTLDIDDDVGLALLLYIYTGNPYEIRCIPLGLEEEGRKYGLPLLAYFAEPYTMTFRTRIKVQELTLALNINNFYAETDQKRNSISFRFEVFEIGSKWSLLLDFQEEGKINLRLTKLSCFEIPMTIELKIHVINANNQSVLLNTQTFHSVFDSKETHSFSTSATCLQTLAPDNRLKLKIAMKVAYHCTQDQGKEYEMTFLSELCGSKQKNPLDFERLKADILNMYECEIFPDLILESKTGQVFVHRFIAAFHSRFIASRLDRSDRPEGVVTSSRLGEPLQLQRIQMPDVAQWALVAIARFMYTGELSDITLEKAVAFLHASKKYKMTQLRSKILHFLRRNLNENTCRDIHSIASSFEEEELEAEAFQLICSELNTTPHLVAFWLWNRECRGESELRTPSSIQHRESTRNLQAASRHLEPMRSMSYYMKDRKKPKSKLKRMKKVAEEKNLSKKKEKNRSAEVRKSVRKNENASVKGIDWCLPRSDKESSDQENSDEKISKRHDKTYINLGKSALSPKNKMKFRKEHETSVNLLGMDVKDIKHRRRRSRHMKKLNIRLGKGSEKIREVQVLLIGRDLDVSPRLSIGHESPITSPLQEPEEVVANQPLGVDNTNAALSARQPEDGDRQESGGQGGQKKQDQSPTYQGRIAGRVLEDIESRPLLSIDNARVSDSPSVEDQGLTVSSLPDTGNQDLAVPPIPSTHDIPPVLSPQHTRFYKPESPQVSHRPDARYQDLDVSLTPSRDDTISLLSNERTRVTKDLEFLLPDVMSHDLKVTPIPSTHDASPMLSPRHTRITEDQGIPLLIAVSQDQGVPPLPNMDDTIPVLSPRGCLITKDQGTSQPIAVSHDKDVPPLLNMDDTDPMLSSERPLYCGRLGPMFTPRPGEVYRYPMLNLEHTRNRVYLGPLFSPRPDAIYQYPTVQTRQSLDDTSPMLSSEHSVIAEFQEVPLPYEAHQDQDVPSPPSTDDIIPMLSFKSICITENQEIPQPDEVCQNIFVPLPSINDTVPVLSYCPVLISQDQGPTAIPQPDAVHQEPSDPEASS